MMNLQLQSIENKDFKYSAVCSFAASIYFPLTRGNHLETTVVDNIGEEKLINCITSTI